MPTDAFGSSSSSVLCDRALRSRISPFHPTCRILTRRLGHCHLIRSSSSPHQATKTDSHCLISASKSGSTFSYMSNNFRLTQRSTSTLFSFESHFPASAFFSIHSNNQCVQARSDCNPFLAPASTFPYTDWGNPSLQSGWGKLLQARPSGCSQAVSAVSFRARSRACFASMGERRCKAEWIASCPSRLPFTIAC